MSTDFYFCFGLHHIIGQSQMKELDLRHGGILPVTVMRLFPCLIKYVPLSAETIQLLLTLHWMTFSLSEVTIIQVLFVCNTHLIPILMRKPIKSNIQPNYLASSSLWKTHTHTHKQSVTLPIIQGNSKMLRVFMESVSLACRSQSLSERLTTADALLKRVTRINSMC